MTQQPHFCGSLFSQSGQECDEAAWWQEKKNTWNAVSSLPFWHFTCVVLRGGLYEGRAQVVHASGPRCMHFSQFCLLCSVTHSTRRDRDSWEQWDAGCLSCHYETTHKSTTPREHPLEKRARAWWDAWEGPQTSCVTFVKLLGPLDLTFLPRKSNNDLLWVCHRFLLWIKEWEGLCELWNNK